MCTAGCLLRLSLGSVFTSSKRKVIWLWHFKFYLYGFFFFFFFKVSISANHVSEVLHVLPILYLDLDLMKK